MQKILVHLLLIACIYTIGFLSAHAYQATIIDPITAYYDVPEQVPTVHLQGIRNGEVFGTVAGRARLVIGNQVLLKHTFTNFSVPAGPLLTHQITIEIPEGMNYIASKRGKKLYPVTSKRVRTIPPQDRLYLATVIEGVEAGFEF